MIYLRTADDSLYEYVRLQLDAAWGHPTADGSTATCFAPADSGVRDSDGRLMLAINNEFASYEPAASMLSVLIGTGQVEQIAEDDYMTAVVRNSP